MHTPSQPNATQRKATHLSKESLLVNAEAGKLDIVMPPAEALDLAVSNIQWFLFQLTLALIHSDFGRSTVKSKVKSCKVYICHFVPSDSPSCDKAEGFAQAVYDGPGLQEL